MIQSTRYIESLHNQGVQGTLPLMEQATTVDELTLYGYIICISNVSKSVTLN